MTKHRRRKGATTKQRNKCFMFYVINLCSKDAVIIVIIQLMNTIDEFKYNLLMNIEVLENNFKQMKKRNTLH